MRIRKFADTVDRVMVIKGEHIAAVFVKGIGFTDQFERATGIGRKNDVVLFWVGLEKFENIGARIFNQLSCGHRGGIGRVRITENVVGEDFLMPSYLR